MLALGLLLLWALEHQQVAAEVEGLTRIINETQNKILQRAKERGYELTIVIDALNQFENEALSATGLVDGDAEESAEQAITVTDIGGRYLLHRIPFDFFLQVHSMTWLPQFPDNVRFVVSALPGRALEQLRARSNVFELEVSHLFFTICRFFVSNKSKH